MAFHRDRQLTPDVLHAVNRRQVARLKTTFERLDLPHSTAHVVEMPEERRGGFLALRIPDAPAVSRALRGRDVFSDARGDVLRLGPAPYLRDDQLDDAIAALGEVLSR